MSLNLPWLASLILAFICGTGVGGLLLMWALLPPDIEP